MDEKQKLNPAGESETINITPVNTADDSTGRDFVAAKMVDLQEQARLAKDLNDELLAWVQEIEGETHDNANDHSYYNYETRGLSYQHLRRLGESEPALLIKNKRRLDFVQWSNAPAEGLVNRGAKLMFGNPFYQPSQEEKRVLDEWTIKIVNNLFYPANETVPNFGRFLGSAYADFFDLDDITIEIRTNGLGKVVGVHLQDPILFKPVIKKPKYKGGIKYEEIDELIHLLGKHPEEQKQAAEPDYLLIYRDQLIAGLDSNRLRKAHFFTKTDFRTAQRGNSIVEQGWRLVVNIVNAMQVNASIFNNSRLPPGLLAFTGGGVNNLALEKLKKIFYAYLSGANNQNRFPTIALNNEKSDVKWIGLRGNSKDLEYHQYMTLLFSMFCGLSGTDPRELSLGSYGDAVSKSSLFQESTDGIIKESRDMGAKIFLKHMQDTLNSPNKEGLNIFQEITGMDVKLEFTGFEIEDKDRRHELTNKELGTIKSINDVLAENDIAPQKYTIGDVNIYDLKGINNANIFNAVMSDINQRRQEEQQAKQQELQASQAAQQPPPGMVPSGSELPPQPEQPQPDSQGPPQTMPVPDDQTDTGEGVNNGEPSTEGQTEEVLTPEEIEFIKKHQAQGAEVDPEILKELQKIK